MFKLKYVKFQANDFEDYFSLVSDKRVMAQITERAIPLEEAKSNFEKLLMRNDKDAIIGTYKIKNTYTNEFIGLGHLSLNEKLDEEAEIGYMLLHKYWGNGYGTEIAQMMIDLAKQTDLRKLTAMIDPENYASRKILVNQQFVSEKVCEIDGLLGEILSRNL
ncbi:GNAT family N-acetyltransferase [Alkalihalobacillus macyae]|uniref:GNAT family N-acetyltransferase n=1 Tax=Guptibacillus hwajinpoensis TaxID=208199 RepID=UPI00273B9D55|nr:GNAT family N-acetyltransferase [Alkalihalobacillus macyae]MDP4550100.1 GNAT family N-acetyltransferase [Alkalihalobacillus macyae]